MPVSVSAKRPEGNAAASDVERPVKRAKLSTHLSDKGKTVTNTNAPGDPDGEIDEGSPTAEDAGPSDLYLDTVCLIRWYLVSDVLTIVF
jgi:hypothetical protein